MKKIEGFWWKALLFSFLFLIGYKFITNFDGFKNHLNNFIDAVFPFILGLVIAFFLFKPAKGLEKVLMNSKLAYVRKKARIISILCVYIVLFAVIGFTFRFLIGAISSNIQELILNWPKYSDRITEYLNTHNFIINDKIIESLNNFAAKILNENMLTKYFTAISSVASSLISVFTGLIVSIYILNERSGLKKICKKLIGKLKSEKVNVFISYFKRIIDIIYSYFTGLALDALVISIISTTFYYIVKLPYSWLLGLLVFVGNMIPFFGPIVAAVVVYIVSAVVMGPLDALWILAFQLVLGQIDGNLIQPKIVSNSVGISPLWVIFAVVFFGAIWGTIGMIIGVPIVAALRMVFIDYLDL